jgi:hypothetical protein
MVAALPAFARQGPDAGTLAELAARPWLAALDSGRARAAYDSAAPFLRSMAGTPDRWESFVAMARPGVTRTARRERVDADTVPVLPGAPPGRYVRLVFRTVTPDAVVTETVVMQVVDGRWRVAMYGVAGR